MSQNEQEHSLRIRELNDSFRKSSARDVYLTKGVAALAEEDRLSAVELVRAFDAFTPDNDPHGEHDFGSFEISGRKLFWKIDYYDLTLASGSNDPASPEITRRVLTIMLAEEY